MKITLAYNFYDNQLTLPEIPPGFRGEMEIISSRPLPDNGVELDEVAKENCILRIASFAGQEPPLLDLQGWNFPRKWWLAKRNVDLSLLPEGTYFAQFAYTDEFSDRIESPWVAFVVGQNGNTQPLSPLAVEMEFEGLGGFYFPNKGLTEMRFRDQDFPIAGSNFAFWLFGNQFIYPPQFPSCATAIELYNNPLEVAPDIGRLPNLRSLDMRDCRLYPTSIDKLIAQAFERYQTGGINMTIKLENTEPYGANFSPSQASIAMIQTLNANGYTITHS